MGEDPFSKGSPPIDRIESKINYYLRQYISESGLFLKHEQFTYHIIEYKHDYICDYLGHPVVDAHKSITYPHHQHFHQQGKDPSTVKGHCLSEQAFFAFDLGIKDPDTVGDVGEGHGADP